MNDRNDGIRMYLAATSWVLGAVLATICGLAIVAGTQIGQFIAITERHRAVITGTVLLTIFLALCASAFYFAYYLFGAP